MSIFQEFERMRENIGAEKYDSIDKYLNTVCSQENIDKYFKEMNEVMKLSPDEWNKKSMELRKKYGVVLLDDVLYKQEEWVKFDNWYNENIKNHKVRIVNYWMRDYGDLAVNAILYKDGIEVANVADSYEETDVKYNIGDIDTELNDKLLKESLRNLLYTDFDNYLELPKISNCSKLLQSIYDDVYSSDSEMCYVDYSEWKEFYADDYTEKDIETLKNEIKQYNLENVIEVDNGEYKILGYGDLLMSFNDDRELNKDNWYALDKLADKIRKEFLSCKTKDEETLNKICDIYDIKLDDFLYVDGYTNFDNFLEDLETTDNSKLFDYDHKMLCELDLKKLRDLFDNGDLLMLDYLKDFIPDNEKELFIKVMDYNEIYANGWDINTLYDMGINDPYWKERADSFIKKYNISKEDFNTDFIEKYFEYRDELLENLGLDEYLFSDNKEIDKDGYIEDEIITDIDKLDNENSFTVARVMNFNHCVELHYTNGKPYIEYGERLDFGYWENEIVEANWFNKNMESSEMINKLNSLFNEYKDNNYNTSFLYDEKGVEMEWN